MQGSALKHARGLNQFSTTLFMLRFSDDLMDDDTLARRRLIVHSGLAAH